MKDLQNNQKTLNKMSGVSPYISIVTLNVNRLNYSIKKYRVAEWILKTKPNYILPARNSTCKDIHRQKVKG